MLERLQVFEQFFLVGQLGAVADLDCRFLFCRVKTEISLLQYFYVFPTTAK